MTGQELWASLLQEAIQGRLVEQRDDEPAVEQIGDAPEDVPFAIPEKWKWVTLKDVGKTQTGTTPPTTHKEYYGDYIPFVKPGDIIENDVYYRAEGLSKKGASVGRIACPNSILMVCIGGSIGKSCIIDRSVSFNQQINTVTVNKNVCDFNYIFSAMISNYFYCAVKESSTGTATPIIKKSTWERIYIPLPPLAEQRRIVARLEELRPLVDDYGAAEAELTRLEAELPDKLRASLLQEAIQGRLVEQRDDEPAVEQIGEAPEDVPFAIPEKWKWVVLRNVGRIVSGGTPKTSVAAYWHDGEIPWITPADLGRNRHNQYIAHGEKYITQEGLNNSSAQTMPKGSVIFSSRAPIGYVAIAKNTLCTNQGCKSVVPNENYAISEWLYYSLICRTQDIQSRASGTTFLEISGGKFGETWIPLSPLAEQRRIVARLEELLPEVARLAG